MAGAVCVVLTPSTLDDIVAAKIHNADYIEVRLDYLDRPQDAGQIRWDRFPVPVIATCRGRTQGGRFDGSVAEELQILERAAQNGARYVDIDYRFAKPISGAEVIASFHDFEATPPDIRDRLAAAIAGPGQIVKIATQVNSWADNRRLFDLLTKETPKPQIIVGMGEIGQITRVLGPSRGSFLTYAADADQSSAPGQLTLQEMTETYRFRKIDRNTKVVGILGNPVAHSKSPEFHNRAFEAANLNFVYLKFLATDVGDFFENAIPLGIHGFSVTIPYKTAVTPFLSSISAEAAAAGAVNTVTWDGAGWRGDNTDVYGVRAALASVDFNPAGKRIVILGAGGAARAAAAAVKEADSVVVLSRRRKETTGWDGRIRFDLLENVRNYDCDLLINATPVGMQPDAERSPLTGEIPARIVFDMVYNPPMTALLRAAADQDKTVISGTTMFTAQAERQFEIWTGLKAGR